METMKKTAIRVIVLIALGLVTGNLWAVQATDANVTDVNGPTIVLDYSKGGKMNPTEDFMYFVPLISPTLVLREISEGNTQTGRMMSVTRDRDGREFSCVCVFKMVGDGTQTYYYDPNQMIEHNLKEHKIGDPLKNILDFIRFNGEGEGRMETRGRMVNGKPVVDEVDVHFVNDDDDVSPVTIRLYTIKPRGKKYDYKDADNRIVARVETLSFKRADKEPKMEIKITSLKNEGAKEGWWSKFKATVANLFIPPLGVDEKGNQTMIDFGHAIYSGDKTFTFPKALNLEEKENEPQVTSAKGS